MIKYYKLFDFLNRHGMKKTDLLEIISAPTLAKISKGQNIQTDVIDKICLYLNCQPSDIMEVISEEAIAPDGTRIIIVPTEEYSAKIQAQIEDNSIIESTENYDIRSVSTDIENK